MIKIKNSVLLCDDLHELYTVYDFDSVIMNACT